MEFSDVSFRSLSEGAEKKVTGADNYFNHQFSSYRNYRFELLPVVTLNKEQAWYGANSTVRKDEHIGQLIQEVCAAIGKDLSAYDNDGDGFIDNICIITAGASEADGGGADRIWPQQGFLHDRGGTVTSGGKTIDSFSVCPELAGLGTFCHEFAHSLGLQDLYDTDGNGSGGQSRGLWDSLSLMDDGSRNNGGATPPNFCAIELEQLGIGNPIPLRSGYHVLHPISSSQEYLRIDSDTEGEYFLLEFRDDQGWDAYAGGKGLLVYHIDRSSNNSWYSDYYKRNLSASERWRNNQVNCRPDHQCARVLAAVPGTGIISGIFFPQPGRKTLGAETDPAFRFWSGATSSLVIDDISFQDDGNISFKVITPVSMRSVSVFQDAAILNWATDNTLSVKECVVSWHRQDDKSTAGISTVTLESRYDGFYYAILDHLQPSTTYDAVIKIICEDGTVHSRSESFTTKSFQKGLRPFIYLRFTTRYEDGTFPAGATLPLRVYNAEGVEHVVWYFEDRPIFPSPDGLWHIPYSGTLKAKVWYEDGTADVIIKEITVR